jgi:hypothetical protein
VPHPIAAGNRVEGWDCQGSIRVYVNQLVGPVLVVLPVHRALTGLPWRATSSVAGEAPVPRPAVACPGSSRETGDDADARRTCGIDQVSTLPALARRAGRAFHGSPRLAPGRGAACGAALI